MSLDNINSALASLRAGRPVVVVDHKSRENEADLVFAAQLASEAWLGFVIRYTSGFICAPLTPERAGRLNLAPMVADNQDPLLTAYTVSVDANNSTITTGISAQDRATTLRTLASPDADLHSLRRPGHIIPLTARPGGVLERPGHTEAAVDLMQLAGLEAVAGIAELVNDAGRLLRESALDRFTQEHGLVRVSIEDLIRYRQNLNQSVKAPKPNQKSPVSFINFMVETRLPTDLGVFRLRGYRDRLGTEHLAIIHGRPAGSSVLARVHSECLTGEALGSRRCECGPQLHEALRLIRNCPEGGVVIYLRGHEGRGIGLINKLRAYKLQDGGTDTLQANLELNLPVDSRSYEPAAQIFKDLGINSIRLLTNNPNKIAQLEEFGIAIRERIPLQVGHSAENDEYLAAKRNRMGHQLDI